MREVFERAWKSLSKISFMLSPDVERLLDKECQVCVSLLIPSFSFFLHLIPPFLPFFAIFTMFVCNLIGLNSLSLSSHLEQCGQLGLGLEKTHIDGEIYITGICCNESQQYMLADVESYLPRQIAVFCKQVSKMLANFVFKFKPSAFCFELCVSAKFCLHAKTVFTTNKECRHDDVMLVSHLCGHYMVKSIKTTEVANNSDSSLRSCISCFSLA